MLHLRAFSECERILDVDAQIPNRALDFRVAPERVRHAANKMLPNVTHVSPPDASNPAGGVIRRLPAGYLASAQDVARCPLFIPQTVVS